MVICTEIRSQRYAMGSSDPFPAIFEIQFGSLNFQATGNGYLMRPTNRDELHPWRSTGLGPMPAAPTTNDPAPAQAAPMSTSTPCAPPALRLVLASGAYGAAPGRARRDTRRHAR
jgi:hypothetical protein